MKAGYTFFISCIILVGCNNEEPKSSIQQQNTEIPKSENAMTLGNACSYSSDVSNTTIYFFNPDVEAEYTIEKIMKLVSLPSNFIIKAANVDNAVATIIPTDSLNLKRFILYNPTFMDSVKLTTGNDFSGWSILAHEIGHHLSGHTLGGTRDSHKQEL